ncbi:unnamed protein product [Prorocentrum cordatum]|uniref:Uncharacterized protein n=1 Tax=Prorocentrum cordatum TaxID=2364126 RepID=A0ABN9R2T1_9DINO|nr:unnamed protein product [Polarella glacialis]
MAGPRPSEPSTVATLAMHHTLSWLLCAAAEAVSAAFPRGRAASGAEPAAGRGAAACSTADKRPRADTAGRRPWAGKWVDTAKGFFHGATISIEDDSWRLEGSVDHVHEGASFSLGASSEDGVRLIESFPDGFVHMFDASCQEGCLRVVRAGTISARSDGDSSFLETCSKPQEWVLQDLAKVALPVLTLGASDVRDLPHLLRSLLPAAEELCGVSRTGAVAERASEVRASLLLVGRYLASHLLEGWYSLLLSAVYVYVTVTIGYPLISSTWARMRDTAALDENEDEWWWVVLEYVAAHLDAHLYVFMGACLATAHRVCSGRRLFVRYSAKMLVIVDCTVNYKLLRAYVSKLRALAFRFTTFGVAGQNGEDHFVHEMTHLTTSEVVILAGRADGRLGTLASMEAASIMSLQQARFIAANPHTGVEVVSVGHNPWTKPGLFQRSVTLSSEHRPAFYSQELLRSAAGGHSPTDVLHGVAMLAKGDLSSASTRTGSEAAFQDVRIEDIETEMAAKELDLEDAQSIIVKFVSKRSYVLNIDPEDFDVTQVLNADVAARLASQQVRGPVRKGTKDRTMTYSAHSPRPPRNVYSKALTKLRPRSFFAREDPALSQPPPVDPQGGPTSSCSTMPTESVGADWLGFKKSASTGHPSFKFTASNIMSVLRGRTLEAVIAQMQSDRHERMALAKRGGLSDLFSDSDTLRGCYEAWAHFASQRAKERMSRVATLVTTLKTKTDREASAALPPQMAPWRTQEEYRQRKRQWMMHYSMLPFAMPHSTRRCFQSWKEHVEAAKAHRPSVTMKVLNALSPVKAYTTFSPMKAYSPAKATACSSLGTVAEHSPHSSKLLWDNVVKKVLMGGDGDGRVVIGEQQGSKARVTKGASGTDLIAELGYMEGIYETRVAAAERLLAFYISALRPSETPRQIQR